MNADQIGGIIRAVLAGVSGIALTYGFSDTQWIAISGAIAAIVTIVWSVYSNSVSHMVAAVAKDADVVKVVVSPALVFATGSEKVVTR